MATARVISVNLGRARDAEWAGQLRVQGRGAQWDEIAPGVLGRAGHAASR